VKLGLIARCDARGLGIQCRGFHDNLPVDRTLVIEAAANISPLTQHPEWYPPDSMNILWDGGPIDPDVMRRFCTGLSAVYCAETPYDWSLFDIARSVNCRTILHVNAELYRPAIDTYLPRPDAVWLHSPWLADQIPHDAIMPVPVDRSHLPYRQRHSARRFVHVVGLRASRDRNGTSTLIRALSRLRPAVPIEVILRSQSPLPRFGLPRNLPDVTLRTEIADVPTVRGLYDDADVMLLPRKYGGGCLPMFEAASLGLPVIMTDTAPQNTILGAESLVPVARSALLRTQFGRIPIVEASPVGLAKRINELVNDDAMVERLSRGSDRIAGEHSWDVWRGKYLAEIEKVIAR